MFGLGLTFLITGLVFSKLDGLGTMASILLSFVFAVTSGAVETAFVGLAQWWAMHPWFPMIGRFAWAFGMPVIFWGIDMAFKMPAMWQSVLLIAVTLFVTGAVVGEIHGLFLVRLAEAE